MFYLPYFLETSISVRHWAVVREPSPFPSSEHLSMSSALEQGLRGACVCALPFAPLAFAAPRLVRCAASSSGSCLPVAVVVSVSGAAVAAAVVVAPCCAADAAPPQRRMIMRRRTTPHGEVRGRSFPCLLRTRLQPPPPPPPPPPLMSAAGLAVAASRFAAGAPPAVVAAASRVGHSDGGGPARWP